MAFNLFPKHPGKDKPAEAKPSDGKPRSGTSARPPSAREVAASVKVRPAVVGGKSAGDVHGDAPRERHVEVTGPPSMIEWTLGLQQRHHVVEANPGLCSVLENAALMHANGQSAQARAALEHGLVHDNEAKVSPLAWLALFDLLQREGDRAAFDQLALQYVVALERSAPAWDESVIQSRPGSKPPVGGYVGLTGKLAGTHATQISNMLVATRKQPQMRLDLGSLTGADDVGAQLLADALGDMRKRKYPLALQHPEKLHRALETLVQQGRGAGEGYWKLLLEMLQWLNNHVAFEDRAVEYAVAFEVSPPSWEPPVAVALMPGQAEASATPPSADNPEIMIWQGVMMGSADPQVAKLAAFRDGLHAIPIDMSGVDRIDFVCAGAFFNAISRAESQRKSVQIIGATPIVRALLLLIGISPRHFIKKAE
jgi:anti-anti-sigma regulatory factor